MRKHATTGGWFLAPGDDRSMRARFQAGRNICGSQVVELKERRHARREESGERMTRILALSAV
jgi:hypothetical protein